MENNVFISSGNVEVRNETEQTAEVVVDLKKVWNQILSRYTDFYAVGTIHIPILEKDAVGHLIRKEITLKISQVFAVDEVVNQQVTLKTIYSGLIQDDTTRVPYAEVEIIVYRVDEVEG